MKIIGQLKAVLGLDKTKYDQGLNQAERKTSTFGAGIKRLGAAMAAAFSVTVILGFIKKIGQAYDVQARAEQSLLVALKGRSDIQKRIIKDAQALQRITLFGDEQTIQAASRLAMMLGTNETAIRRLLPLVQDLAVAKFEGNLVTAAELVAKSVGSSTNALSRYGIQIEGTAGSSERLEMAMIALNKQVGGQAEAAANVGIGAFKQLGNIIGDIMEALGRPALESKTYKGLTQFGKDFVEILADEDTGFLKALWQSWFRREKTLQEIRAEAGAEIGEGAPGGTEVYVKTLADLNEELAGYKEQLDATAISDRKTIKNLVDKIKYTEDYIKLLTSGQALTPGSVKGPKRVTAPAMPTGIPLPAIPGLTGTPDIMKQQTEDLTGALWIQDEAVGILANSFNTLFEGGEDGFRNMIDSMISSFKRLVAEIAAKAAILGLISLIFPGTAFGASALTGLRTMFTIPGAASGGTVPPGYPHDTFPAMLSSGETILTARQSRELNRMINVHVTGEIAGNIINLAQRRSQYES